MLNDICEPIKDFCSKSVCQRVLGIHWSLTEEKNNALSERQKNLDRKKWRQRKFLFFVSSFYDPLGLISLYLIRTNIRLQELWKNGREGDKAINGDNGKAIKDWVQETELLGPVGVNRLVGGTALGAQWKFMKSAKQHWKQQQ